MVSLNKIGVSLMQSRMSKYYEDNDTTNSRVHKNQELYSTISKTP